MGRRINTVMQTCFFAICGVLPREEAIAHIKKSIEKTYGKRGQKWCEELRGRGSGPRSSARDVSAGSHELPRGRVRRWSPNRRRTLCRKVTAVMMAGKGDLLPVSAFPVDGTGR